MFPLIANAQTFGGQYITDVITSAQGWVSALIPLMLGLALVAFFYGLVRYLFGGVETKESAKMYMLWGIIAIAVMASIWGIVTLLQNVVGVQSTSTFSAPEVTNL